MITKESLRAEETLKDLTDNQVDVILGQLKTRIGEIHGLYDKDFEEVTGLKKPSGSGSSYTFWTQKMKEFKEASEKDDGSKAKIEELEGQINTLNEQIKAGKGDKALVTQLEEKIKTHEGTIEEYKTQLQTEKDAHVATKDANEAILVQGEFTSASADLKFKEGTSDTAKALLIQNAEAAILKEYSLSFVKDEGTGKMTPVLAKNGVPVGDKLSDLMANQLKGELSEKRTQTGTQTKPTGKLDIKDNVIDIGTDFKNQPQAMRALHEAILAQGHSVDSPEYKAIKDTTWKEVIQPLELPLRT